MIPPCKTSTVSSKCVAGWIKVMVFHIRLPWQNQPSQNSTSQTFFYFFFWNWRVSLWWTTQGGMVKEEMSRGGGKEKHNAWSNAVFITVLCQKQFLLSFSSIFVSLTRTDPVQSRFPVNFISWRTPLNSGSMLFHCHCCSDERWKWDYFHTQMCSSHLHKL